MVLLCLVAAAAAQDDPADVDPLVGQVFDDGESDDPSLTASPAPLPTVDEQWLMSKRRELVALNDTANKRTEEARGRRNSSFVHYVRVLRKIIAAVHRYNELAAEVAARNVSSTRFAPIHPGYWGGASDMPFSTAREVVFGVLLVAFAVLAVLMVLNRSVVEKFWVVLLVVSLVVIGLTILQASLERVKRELDSSLVLALEVLGFVYQSLLTVTVTVCATVLCKALYAAAYPDRPHLSPLVFIVPLCAVGAAICYGIFALVYPVVTGVYLVNATNLICYSLATANCLALAIACLLSVIRKPSLQSAIVFVACLLLFAVSTVSLVLLAMYTFVSMINFEIALGLMSVIAPALGFTELWLYLFFSVRNVSKRKSVASDAANECSELSEMRVPLRYAE